MAQTELTRRSLIQTGVAAGVATGAVLAAPAGLAGLAHAAPAAPKPKDLEILNFALGLEHLESAFYRQVLGAHQERAYLYGRHLSVIQALATAEAAHVTTLQDAITKAGGTPVAAVNYKFPSNVFVSTTALSWFAWTLEEIGVGAYLGSIGDIKNSGLRAAFTSIYGAETRHAGVLRNLGGFDFAPRYFENALTVAQVQSLVAPYLA